MLLAIDCGNTRTKWAAFNALGEVTHHGVCINSEVELIKFLPEPLAFESIVISNVAGEYLAAVLAKKLVRYGTAIHWLKSTAEIGNVKNSYANPESLGSDRWAALIAAWQLQKASCVVVNAGTAVTVDALSVCDGHAEFIGGMILPGMHLMLKSLGMATAQLPDIPAEKSVTAVNNQHSILFAKNTADAMLAGALNAACGAIMQMHAALSEQCKQTPYIVLSGGDAQYIYNNLSGDVTNRVLIVDNLVLRGLFFIEKLRLTTIRQSGQQ